LLSQFILIAQECRTIRNFNAAAEIVGEREREREKEREIRKENIINFFFSFSKVAGLENSSVRRLKKTWK